jgi:hypothetical protein
MNTRLNKKVKKDLDAYFKGLKGSDPAVHHGIKHILIGALRDANFHSEAKKVSNMFPKANQSKYAGRKDWENSLEQNHGVPIAKSAKWDGHDIIDAISYWVSMFIGGPVGAKVSSLKEGINENLRNFVNQYIKEVTHSYDYEDMSGTRENMSNEDENDKEEIKIGEYQTKYFHVCPGASSLYGDIESKGVDMDMAERSVRLQDALFFIEEHVGRDGYSPDKDYVMVAKNIAKNIMKMGKMMGLEKEHSYIQGHVDTIIKSVEGKKLEERIIELTEENKPTNPELWSRALAAARAKYDVYPSAYANAFASKWYKDKGGSWRTTKESVNEAKVIKKNIKDIEDGDVIVTGRNKHFKVDYIDPWSAGGRILVGKDVKTGKNGKMKVKFLTPKGKSGTADDTILMVLKESVNEAKSMDTKKRLKVYDKLKKGDEITIKYGSSMSSGREGKFKVTKGKTVVGKQKVERIILQNVANPKGVKYYLYQRNGNVTMAIGDMAASIEDMHESVNEARYYITRNLGRGQGKALVKHYDKKKNQTTDNPIEFKSYKDAQKEVEKRQRGGSMGGQMTAYIITDKNMKPLKESVNEGLSVTDERHFGKKGIIIMIDDNGKKVSAIFKNKKNADKYNRNKASDLKALLDLAKNTPYPKAIDESVNEAKEPEVITQLRKIVKDKQNDLIKDTKSGKKVRVDMNSANLMVQVYDALKKQSNKDKFVKSGIVMMGHTSYKLMKKENITEYDVENGQDIREFVEFIESYKVDINEAEYQGRKVELGKISQGDVKKFKVYVKNAKGNVVKVNFGQKGMTIKKGNPGARKSFRARMNCDSPGPRWKARYWSCRKW